MGVAVQIPGDRSLPPGYPHSHASEQARAIASSGMILRVQVGSGVHGITVEGGNDDRDEMAICLEPVEYVVGLARVPNGRGAGHPFEQYERHTAWDRAGGVNERSGAGDLDVVVYSARTWAGLALAGNPTVLLAPFTPDAETMIRTEAACELVDNAHRFVSKLAADRFLGYPDAQRCAVTGESGAHANRPELVAVHGCDTKFAAHALRLGIQGVELLTSGRMHLPMLDEHRARLRAIRRGEVSLQNVLHDIAGLENRLVEVRRSSDVPDRPDRRWVDDWLIRSYRDFWRTARSQRT